MKEKEKCIKIKNKRKVLERLKSGAMLIKDYHYTVQHDQICIYAAILGNIDNYEYIPEEYKFKNTVIDAYYTSYIKNQEKEVLKAKEYEDYYPWELVIERALKEDTVHSPVEIIKSIVEDMTDEELNDLRHRVGSIAKTFIDPDMNDSIATIQDNYIISSHKSNNKASIAEEEKTRK